MKFVGEAFDLPATARVGFAVKPLRRLHNDYEEWGDEFTIVADGVFPRAGSAYVAGGVEHISSNFMALRAGGTMGRDTGPGYSAGMGLYINRNNPDRPQFSFDYAFVDSGELNFQHRAGITLRFGASRSRGISERSFWRRVETDIPQRDPESMRPQLETSQPEPEPVKPIRRKQRALPPLEPLLERKGVLR